MTNSSRTNWAFVNDRKLEAGQSCPVQDSDQIMIGAYVLNVRETTAYDDAVVSISDSEAVLLTPDVPSFAPEAHEERDPLRILHIEADTQDRIPGNDFLSEDEKTVPQPTPDALGWAFLEGLGVAAPLNAQIAPDPAFMREAGALVRVCVQGMLELLSARTTVKKNIRAPITHIASARNNPLKFSPNVNVALGYLFGPRVPGFLGPVDAVEEAFKDLCAHGVGVMSGVNLGLQYVLEQFAPERIVKANASEHTGLWTLRRQARLWRAYATYYERIKDDINGPFGQVFLEAYLDMAHPARPQAALRRLEDHL